MTSPLVVDTSAAMAWLLESQATPSGDALIQELKQAPRMLLAPSCFRWEIRHALLKFERRHVVQPDAIESQLAVLEATMQIELDDDEAVLLSRLDAIRLIARRFSLSMFDAAYVEQTHRLVGELASRDGRLLAAARGLGCAVRDLR